MKATNFQSGAWIQGDSPYPEIFHITSVKKE
jgi:hypothetical protein